jgi:hypothetical protein
VGCRLGRSAFLRVGIGFYLGWDGMGWDGMVDEGGGGLEMRKWNDMDEMLGVVLALTARSSNIIFLVLIMQALHLPLGFGFRY